MDKDIFLLLQWNFNQKDQKHFSQDKLIENPYKMLVILFVF